MKTHHFNLLVAGFVLAIFLDALLLKDIVWMIIDPVLFLTNLYLYFKGENNQEKKI